MTQIINDYQKLIETIIRYVKQNNLPIIIAIAGPPASGKSTIAKKIVSELNNNKYQTAFCPMDGFHLSNKILTKRGILEKKGQIITFDAQKYTKAISKLTKKEKFWWPIYSRLKHEPIKKGTHINGTEKIFVVEGNYILNNQEPWKSTAKNFSLKIFIDAPDKILRQRLRQRHQKGGCSINDANKKIKQNDMVNAEITREHKQNADVFFNPKIVIPES